MATLLNQSLAACILALAAASVCAAPAPSETPAKAAKAVKAKQADAATEAEPDITNAVTTEYSCELGNKVTIYTIDADTSFITLRWKNKLHRLQKVATTTGAQRFENPSFGLVWIGIPAKGILLDSKLGRQLANECKNAEQSKTAALATATDVKA